MAIEIVIRGDNAKEVLAELASLSGAFAVVDKVKATVSKEEKVEAVKPAKTRKVEKPVEQQEEQQQEEQQQEAVEHDAAEIEAAIIGDAPLVTVEELRAKATEVSKAGKQQAVKDLIKAFGATSISTIAEDQRDAAYAQLEALANA